MGLIPVEELGGLVKARHRKPEREPMVPGKCYHKDCGGKPKQFCPYKGKHPN